MSQMTLPPEGECPDPLDTQLNALYSISSNIELAIIKGQKEQAKALLADGLAQSCQLLHQLQGIDLLKPVIPSETIRRMASKGEQVLKFLRLERDLLKQTKLDPQVTDYLLGKLRELINSGTELPQNWRQDLDLLAKLVCEEAKKTAAPGNRPLLIRATMAGGGGLIAILNLLPPVQGALSPQVTTLSTSGGVWLISEAFRDQLKSFFPKKGH